MIDIEKIVSEAKTWGYVLIPKENFEDFTRRILATYDINEGMSEDKVKQKLHSDLRRISDFYVDYEQNYVVLPNTKMARRIQRTLDGKEDIRGFTMSFKSFERLAEARTKTSECFEIAEKLKEYNIPFDRAIDVSNLSKNLREKVMSNLDEEVFQKVVRNGYCQLLEDVEKNDLTKKQKADFLSIINMPNYILPPGDEDDLYHKDCWDIRTVEDLKNVDNIKDTKINDLMDRTHTEKYTIYDIKTEFCRRFLNADPQLIESMCYCPENKEIFSKMDSYEELIEMIECGENDQDRIKLVKTYAKYLYSNQTIELPGELKFKAYMYVDDDQIDKFDAREVDDGGTRDDYAVYFNRASLSKNSIYKKTRKECELELPYQMIKNGRSVRYESYTKAIPKFVFPKEELDFDDIKRTYISLEAIELEKDIRNPKYYGREIAASYTAKQYDAQKEEHERVDFLRKVELERKFGGILGEVGIDIRVFERHFGNDSASRLLSKEEIESFIDQDQKRILEERARIIEEERMKKKKETEDDPSL